MRWLTLAIALGTLGSVWAEDVVFVQTDTAGVYDGRVGEIVAVTPSQVVLRTAQGDQLFVRNAVHRVALAGLPRVTNRSGWAQTIETYWNAERSPLVEAVQSLPIVGQPLRVLDNIPTPIASTLATVALCFALSWAAYKAYELTVMGRETHRLGRLRLQLEIAKIRNEALDLSRKLTFRDAAVLEALDLPLPEPPQKIQIDDERQHFGKHSRLVKPFMSEIDRYDQRCLYETEALIAYRRGVGRARCLKIRRTAWFVIGEMVCGLYAIVCFLAGVGLFLPAMGEAEGAENAPFGVVMFLLAVFLARQAVRLNLKLRDLRKAYERARRSASRVVLEEIIGTA